MSKEVSDLEKQCLDLINAFHINVGFSEGDYRRNNPLTPNDPATIATLAAELLGHLCLPKPKTCEWNIVKQYGGKGTLWDTNCGYHTTHKTSYYNFCPFCTGRILEVDDENKE